MIDASSLLPGADVWFMVLDTLRYDVAQDAFENDRLPHFSKLLPTSGWEKRHSPATFTYPSHHAMFSGFLPTPIASGKHPRLFAMDFLGSESIGPQTAVFKQSNLIEGLAAADYKTVCIGGVGFFNMQNSLGSVFPNMFQHAHWSEQTSVTDPHSTEHQFSIAKNYITSDIQTPLCCFINISALHQPNWFYLPAHQQDPDKKDSLDSHKAALCYVDSQLHIIHDAWLKRIQASQRPVLTIICSDHGTLYGDDGYSGHRIVHDNVLHVPYLETVLNP